MPATDVLADLRQMIQGRCPDCGRRAEVTIAGACTGRGGERSWTCEGPEGEEHDETSWDEESVAQGLYDKGYGEAFVREFLRTRGRV